MKISFYVQAIHNFVLKSFKKGSLLCVLKHTLLSIYIYSNFMFFLEKEYILVMTNVNSFLFDRMPCLTST